MHHRTEDSMRPGQLTSFDVIIGSDLRFPGGTSHSIAEEVTAQHRAGYRTGLLHMNGPLVQKVRAVNPLIRRQVHAGAAELIVGPEPVQCDTLVLRHPAVVQEAIEHLPPVEANRIVVVANAGPTDIDGRSHYQPAQVDAAVRQHLGQDALWAPIGPLVREEVAPHVPAERLLGEDWVNIIDVDAWQVRRPGWSADRPVIGRHSRNSPQKWPADAATIRSVYPVDGSWDVRILGGAEAAVAQLGSYPESWTVLPFGVVDPKDFLAELDFFVYYHDPRWVEAFGRTILEAMASGAVAVLPPHFEPLFAEAARYAEPEQVRGLIEDLYADREAYLDQVRRAEGVVRSRFGHEAHVQRLARLGVPNPSGGGTHTRSNDRTDPPVPVETTGSVSAGPTGASVADRRRLLLISSNGAGMGHLTRLLAYARRMGADTEPYFLSLSQAAPVVSRFGFRYEYLPSSGALAMPTSNWRRLFIARVGECLERVRPHAVVFDGTWPYNGTVELREAFPHIPWVWSRRGMWRQEANRDQLDKAEWFDHIIEPGDFAAEYDMGPTRSAPAQRVPPVTLLDRADLQSRQDARAELGLPAEGRLGLISLGAGNINDTQSDIGAAAAALSELDVAVCLTRPEIAGGTVRSDVHLVRDYPLARRYAAFDVVISATGYNSFQELIRMGVPSLFVPNPATAVDDQGARARFAADQGWAHSVAGLDAVEAMPLLADLLERGQEMIGQAARHDPGNGAIQASAAIASVIKEAR